MARASRDGLTVPLRSACSLRSRHFVNSLNCRILLAVHDVRAAYAVAPATACLANSVMRA
ncbi:hypothetical protein DVQ41_16425 [Yersinia enterocolitica]|nr:hypothetical protein [Yersinia enterocolitica]QBP98946.1 hypothetical protein YEY1_09250 [Yersinia enterocolitica subsp. palearctica]EKN4927665.1 hypothetical protein [Yersinia enterocolitica]EKN4931669.1 hypothetical protein [Yersinia enterocolitica]EKN5013939.1 hypothetical protein [Yersinia enterocolitica]